MAVKKSKNAGAWIVYLSLGAGLASSILQWADSPLAPALPGWVLLVLGLIVQLGQLKTGMSVTRIVTTLAMLSGGAGFTVAGAHSAGVAPVSEVYKGDIVDDADVPEETDVANAPTNDFMVTE